MILARGAFSIAALLAVSHWFLAAGLVYAQSPELKSAKQDILESAEKLAGDADNEIVRKEAVLKVIEFSLVETKDFIKKIQSFKNLSPELVRLRKFLLESLQALLTDQVEFLNQLNSESLNSEALTQLAVDFKKWRGGIYVLELKKAIDFVLALQASNILKIADSRFLNIGEDLRRLRGSKIIDTQSLQPLLVGAGLDLKEAHKIQKAVLAAVLDYLPAATSTQLTTATSTQQVAATTTLEVSDGASAPEVKSLIGDLLVKIKSVYKKFLAMSRIVDAQLE